MAVVTNSKVEKTVKDTDFESDMVREVYTQAKREYEIHEKELLESLTSGGNEHHLEYKLLAKGTQSDIMTSYQSLVAVISLGFPLHLTRIHQQTPRTHQEQLP